MKWAFIADYHHETEYEIFNNEAASNDLIQEDHDGPKLLLKGYHISADQLDVLFTFIIEKLTLISVNYVRVNQLIIK